MFYVRLKEYYKLTLVTDLAIKICPRLDGSWVPRTNRNLTLDYNRRPNCLDRKIKKIALTYEHKERRTWIRT